MYINSGAIHVHSATGVLTVRGGKQLSLRGGGYIRGESIDKTPFLDVFRYSSVEGWLLSTNMGVENLTRTQKYVYQEQ